MTAKLRLGGMAAALAIGGLALLAVLALAVTGSLPRPVLAVVITLGLVVLVTGIILAAVWVTRSSIVEAAPRASDAECAASRQAESSVAVQRLRSAAIGGALLLLSGSFTMLSLYIGSISNHMKEPAGTMRDFTLMAGAVAAVLHVATFAGLGVYLLVVACRVKGPTPLAR